MHAGGQADALHHVLDHLLAALRKVDKAPALGLLALRRLEERLIVGSWQLRKTADASLRMCSAALGINARCCMLTASGACTQVDGQLSVSSSVMLRTSPMKKSNASRQGSSYRQLSPLCSTIGRRLPRLEGVHSVENAVRGPSSSLTATQGQGGVCRLS